MTDHDAPFDRYLLETPLLDYRSESIRQLILDRWWKNISTHERIGRVHDFVRNEIKFGYNADDALPASRVLRDGYGQCNTKSILLMALLRALGIPCRFHGFTIHKQLQNGIVPTLVYPLTPDNILHSWVEIFHEGRWIDLEGFILDSAVISSLQAAFPDRSNLCGYGVGTDCLQKPPVEWQGMGTYIQVTGINHDFGVFDSPDQFYAERRQLTGLKGILYRYIVRHWMNRRVASLRSGTLPGAAASAYGCREEHW